jgi:hypothetical protein
VVRGGRRDSPARSVTDFGRVTHLWGRLFAHCGWLFALQWSGALNPFLSAGLVRQLEPSARLIWLLGKAGWVCDVRWPKPQRFAALRLPRPSAHQAERRTSRGKGTDRG